MNAFTFCSLSSVMSLEWGEMRRVVYGGKPEKLIKIYLNGFSRYVLLVCPRSNGVKVSVFPGSKLTFLLTSSTASGRPPSVTCWQRGEQEKSVLDFTILLSINRTCFNFAHLEFRTYRNQMNCLLPERRYEFRNSHYTGSISGPSSASAVAE